MRVSNLGYHRPLSDLHGRGEDRAYTPGPSRYQRAEKVSQGPAHPNGCTYKFGAIRVWIPLNEVIDVSALHPFRNHRELPPNYRYTEKWQDVRVLEVFPGNRFSAESLQSTGLNRRKVCAGKTLTPRIPSKSLARSTRGTFMATIVPLYAHRNTVAWPPWQSLPFDFQER